MYILYTTCYQNPHVYKSSKDAMLKSTQVITHVIYVPILHSESSVIMRTEDMPVSISHCRKESAISKYFLLKVLTCSSFVACTNFFNFSLWLDLSQTDWHCFSCTLNTYCTRYTTHSFFLMHFAHHICNACTCILLIQTVKKWSCIYSLLNTAHPVGAQCSNYSFQECYCTIQQYKDVLSNFHLSDICLELFLNDFKLIHQNLYKLKVYSSKDPAEFFLCLFKENLKVKSRHTYN